MSVNRLTIFLLVIVFLTTISAELKAPFKQSSPKSAGEILEASVNAGCGASYCTFHKGDHAQLDFKFKLRKPARRVRVRVIAKVGAIQHDFILPKHEVCEILGGCPLKPDTVYSYHNKMLISEKYPSVRVEEMRYCLIDGKGRELVSLSLPVMIAEKDS